MKLPSLAKGRAGAAGGAFSGVLEAEEDMLFPGAPLPQFYRAQDAESPADSRKRVLEEEEEEPVRKPVLQGPRKPLKLPLCHMPPQTSEH